MNRLWNPYRRHAVGFALIFFLSIFGLLPGPVPAGSGGGSIQVLQAPSDDPEQVPDINPGDPAESEDSSEEVPKNQVLLHDLRVELDLQAHRISAKDTLQILVQDKKQDSLDLLLNPRLKIKRVVGDQKGKILILPADSGQPFKRVEIPLSGLGEKDRTRITIEYEGEVFDPVQKSESLGFVTGDKTSGIISTAGVYLPATGYFVPYHEGSLPVFNVEVSVPKPFLAVTQGKLMWRKTEGNQNRSRWLGDTPADGLTLVAGSYFATTQNVNGIAVSTYFLEDRPELAARYLEKLAEYLGIYTKFLGPYPYSRFDVVENFFESGYSFPAFTLLGRGVFQRGEKALQPGYLDHELVHSWWGNYVFGDPGQGNWLEGLTSYFANYYYKELKLGPEEALEHRKRISQKYSVRVNPKNEYALRDFQEKNSDFDDDIGYGKGSMVFHMLRKITGDEMFFDTMREFAKRYGGKRAGWKEIQSIFEEKKGESLAWFFSEWLDRKGGPRIQMENVESRPGPDGFDVEGEIAQEGDSYVLEVPVRVRFSDGGSEDVRVSARETRSPFKASFGRLPVSVEMDPGFDLFRLLGNDEIPPSLNTTLNSEGNKILLARDEPAFSGPIFQQVAKMAVDQNKGTLVKAGEDFAGRSLLVLGEARKNPGVADLLKRGLPKGVVLNPDSFQINGTVYDRQTQSLLLSFRHPDKPNRSVTLYFGLSPDAVKRANYIFYYGWDSYVVFEDGDPVSRGDFSKEEKNTRRDLIDQTVEQIDPDRLMDHVKYLASEKLQGRFPDTFGSELGKKYIEKQFQEAGLSPISENGTDRVFRQPFSIWCRDLKLASFLFSGGAGIGGGKAFPFRFSARGSVTLEPVFAGYGLSVEGYDDYAGVNTAGKAVILLDGLPGFLPPTSGKAELLMEKVKNAKAHGALGIIFIQGAEAVPEYDPYLTYPSRMPESFRSSLTGNETDGQINLKILQRGSTVPQPPDDLKVPVVMVNTAQDPIPGFDPVLLAGEIEKNRAPQSRPFPGTTVQLGVQFLETKVFGENVIGFLEGSDPKLKNEVIVLGAHHDHLGVDKEGKIYLGADDDASGVAALVEASFALAKKRSLLKRSILFVAFDGEEWGLRGSSHFVKNFPFPNRKMAAMLNADAIGRGKEGTVYLIGETVYPGLAANSLGLLDSLNLKKGKNIDPFAYKYGSDHYPFHEMGIPALMFYSSDYREMNSLKDTVDKILPDNLGRIAQLFYLSALNLAVSTSDLGQTLGHPPGAENKSASETEEIHLANLRQLTFGGENAEAYFSPDGTRLIFQSKPDGAECDQIYIMGTDGTNPVRVSEGGGATTCSYFVEGGNRIIYSSTRLGGEACPKRPDFHGGYVWPLFRSYDIFSVNPDGSDLKRLTETDGYDAEGTVSPDGKTIVFTSVRDGDLDIYTMDTQGGNVKRLTRELGYDGGAFFSPDGTKIVYRANHPQDPKEVADYRDLLSQGMVRPTTLEIFVMNADGSNKVQVTHGNAASFAPFFHPDGRRIVFSSNLDDPEGRNFDLYLVNVDGTGLERITFNPTFDGFPMFSPDGKKLVFASNRNNRKPGETNVFIADWVDGVHAAAPQEGTSDPGREKRVAMKNREGSLKETRAGGGRTADTVSELSEEGRRLNAFFFFGGSFFLAPK